MAVGILAQMANKFRCVFKIPQKRPVCSGTFADFMGWGLQSICTQHEKQMLECVYNT